MSDFGSALESGARLLRGLPRRRAHVAQARRTAAAWAADHPGLQAQLVVDERPGTPVVDFDLLLSDPEGGTVALSAQAEDGVPWLIDHSTHWAAGQLVTVDEVHLSVAQALTMIRSLSRRDTTPHDEIVDQCLIINEVAGDDGPVSDEELQAAADEFRRGRGLHDRAATLAWLTEMGMTPGSSRTTSAASPAAGASAAARRPSSARPAWPPAPGTSTGSAPPGSPGRRGTSPATSPSWPPSTAPGPPPWRSWTARSRR
nr:hypothetical protein GCM10020093_041070 [Planobispora longispora]